MDENAQPYFDELEKAGILFYDPILAAEKVNEVYESVVYTVVFSQVMRARLPAVDSAFGYGIFLCAGILTWGLFADIANRSQNVFLDNAALLKKMNFPRLCLPVVVVINAMLNFSIVFGLFTVFLLVSGNFPGATYLALLPLLLILLAELFLLAG